MRMHDGPHVRPRLVNLAVDETLGVQAALLHVHGVVIEIELEDVLFAYELGRK